MSIVTPLKKQKKMHNLKQIKEQRESMESQVKLKKQKAIQLLSDWIDLVGVEEVAQKFVPLYENSYNYLHKFSEVPINGEGYKLRMRMRAMMRVYSCLNHPEPLKNIDKFIVKEETYNIILEILN